MTSIGPMPVALKGLVYLAPFGAKPPPHMAFGASLPTKPKASCVSPARNLLQGVGEGEKKRE
jgi:hypothetical protein